jgi:hypothetical protein
MKGQAGRKNGEKVEGECERRTGWEGGGVEGWMAKEA